jgi:hypothetical protein
MGWVHCRRLNRRRWEPRWACSRAGLAAYADSVRWTRATPDEWLTTAALSFIGAGIILHVGIGLRWPFAHQTKQENP